MKMSEAHQNSGAKDKRNERLWKYTWLENCQVQRSGTPPSTTERNYSPHSVWGADDATVWYFLARAGKVPLDCPCPGDEMWYVMPGNTIIQDAFIPQDMIIGPCRTRSAAEIEWRMNEDTNE